MTQDINDVAGDPELRLLPNASAHELNADGQHDERDDSSECPGCHPAPARPRPTPSYVVTVADTGPGRGACPECGQLYGNYHTEGCQRPRL